MSKKKTIKTFGLSNASVNNRTTVLLLTVIIVVAGIFSYNSMPKEAFPEIVMPQIFITTPYPGNGPSDIEKLITRPIEKELKSMTGVDKITSSSLQGMSSINVEFDFSVSVEEALRKVKDKVDIAKADPDFPTDLPADPNIFEMNFSELIPIMNVNLRGEFSMDQLKEYGEYLEDEIEELPEINKVDIRGISEKEVQINVDLPSMEAVKLGLNDIAQAVQQENISISGGELLVDNFRSTVSVEGQFKNINEIEDIIVKQENNNIVYLRDIADVKFVEEEKKSYAREFSKPVIMLDIIKRGGENLIQASASIREIIKEAQRDYLPENLEISITGDQSEATETQLDELINSILFGVILVVLVLLFFLGLRNALFVGVAIPMSMLLSFFILNAAGVTLNMMVLFSLVLALGMLVDNGIVVVENIYRLMDEGKPPIQAAKEGVGEVAWPIIASTATTLAAFVPLAIWPGMMGEFMKFLPITLMIVLASSLFVALVINPVLTALFMKVDQEEINKKRVLMISAILGGIALLCYLTMGVFWLPNLFLIVALVLLLNAYVLFPASKKFQSNVMPRLEKIYEKSLRKMLVGNRPKWLLVGMFAMLIGSFGLVGAFQPNVLFFPENMPLYINVYVQAPLGTDIEKTNEVTKEVERMVTEQLEKDAYYWDGDEKKPMVVDGVTLKKNSIVSSVIAQVGEGTADPAQGPVFGDSPNKARIQISFLKYADRMGINTSDILNDLQKTIKGIPGVNITVSQNVDGPPQGNPINLELRGDDYIQLIGVADSLRQFVNGSYIAGIEDLKLDIETGKPEMPIIIDRDKARRMNVSTYQIGDAMRTSLFGKEISSYKEGEDDYPIMLRLAKEYAYNASALMDQKITFRNQSNGRIVQVPLSSVAHKERGSTYSAVKRIDLNRTVTVFSNVLQGYNATEVNNEIKTALEDFTLPKGISLSVTGQQEEQAKEMSFLLTALAIAVSLILLIIIAQFNSASTPLIILTSVLLSLIGVLLGLITFQMDFIIIMTMIGIISLAGVVVNNAIVLIDYTKLIETRKLAFKKFGFNVGGKKGTEAEDLMRKDIPTASFEDEIIDDTDFEPEVEKVFLDRDEMYEAVVEGGKKRLRPVLLTAITTILGLVPLAVGLNIDFAGLLNDLDPNIYMGGDNVVFWGPMSWTIIFGLTFATFLTLVVVPAMYLLIKRLKYRFKRA
ncbi:MAG: efflux RND transporter permease subunit [Flavobacteriales bacterium]|nr:efflux RND transporter permease subunit [Flavobacteriales bacterium]